jgi:hypothetical protein
MARGTLLCLAVPLACGLITLGTLMGQYHFEFAQTEHSERKQPVRQAVHDGSVRLEADLAQQLKAAQKDTEARVQEQQQQHDALMDEPKQAALALMLQSRVAASTYAFNHRQHSFFLPGASACAPPHALQLYSHALLSGCAGMPKLEDTPEKHCSLAIPFGKDKLAW